MIERAMPSRLCFFFALVAFLSAFLGLHTPIPTPGGSLTQLGLALITLGLLLP